MIVLAFLISGGLAGLAERCRVHVQMTGHTVRFIIEDVTRYEPQGGGGR